MTRRSQRAEAMSRSVQEQERITKERPASVAIVTPMIASTASEIGMISASA